MAYSESKKVHVEISISSIKEIKLVCLIRHRVEAFQSNSSVALKHIMSPNIFIFLCSIVALFLLQSSSSVSEETGSDSLSEEVGSSHIQPWKRFPCIVGTRWRVQRCRTGRRFFHKLDQQVQVLHAFLIRSLKILPIHS